jgi:hypothetical protein
MSYRELNINPIVHDSLDILINQSQNISRDKSTATYIIKQAQYNNFLQTINDLNFLTKYTNNSPLNNPNYNPRTKLDIIIKSNKRLIDYVNNIEENFNKKFNSREVKKGRNNGLLTSDKFAYVYNQLHVDNDNKYKSHFELAATIFNLNPNIIKSCIFVEQLRAFYTFK